MKTAVFFIIIFFSITSLFSQSKVLQEGEELNYIVYYGFIKLGEVKLNITGQKKEDDKVIYLAKSTMKTYSGIPFVSLNSVFESEMIYNGKELYTRRFKALEYKEDAIIKIDYIFDYDSNNVHVLKINNGRVERDEKIQFHENVKFQDGLSLFYMARINSFFKENFLTPVFINESETSINYYYSSVSEEISIPLVDDDIKSIRCDGVANFEGVFGLTGEFVGWFSKDDARVPIKSQLNLLIGSTTLELESYKRKGWRLGE